MVSALFAHVAQQHERSAGTALTKREVFERLEQLADDSAPSKYNGRPLRHGEAADGDDPVYRVQWVNLMGSPVVDSQFRYVDAAEGATVHLELLSGVTKGKKLAGERVFRKFYTAAFEQL